MNRRRYDEVVSLVASVVLGAAVGDFHNIVDAIWNQFSCGGISSAYWCGFLANFTAGAMFLVFFRNVHGLISYDIWRENSKYDPPFEERNVHLFWFFLFALFAAILFPYLPIYLFKNYAADATKAPDWLLLGALALPFAIYWVWNRIWRCALRKHPPRRTATPEEYLAYDELLRFTERWCWLDWISISCTIGVGIAFAHARGKFLGLSFFGLSCATFCAVTVVTFVWDYLVNRKYYFAMIVQPAKEQKASHYELSDLWEFVLPDGLAYCHWGGKDQSDELIKTLEIGQHDRVLELCCGCGGTLSRLPRAEEVWGLDISEAAIEHAKKTVNNDKVRFVVADAHKMPFLTGYFTKVFSQDGDAWLEPNKAQLMSEIFRIMKPGGRFVYQSYVATKPGSGWRGRFARWRRRISGKISAPAGEQRCGRRVAIPFALRRPILQNRKTWALLSRCGYRDAIIPTVEGLPKMFEDAGFKISPRIDLTDDYAKDNRRMRKCFKRNKHHIRKKFGSDKVSALRDLLWWEKRLFRKRLFRKTWWEGVRVVAEKPQSC